MTSHEKERDTGRETDRQKTQQKQRYSKTQFLISPGNCTGSQENPRILMNTSQIFREACGGVFLTFILF
jgi:hypothetical protein